ncbi:MAG: tetratricopeptide repeat protein [Acidobacteriota bacterium]
MKRRKRPFSAWILALSVGLIAAEPVAWGAAADPTQEFEAAIRAYYRGDYREAGALAGRLAESRPAAAGPLVLLARVEAALGNPQKAFTKLQRALQIEPNHTEALYFLGHLASLLSQMEYQRLFAMAPDSARVHQIMAEAYRAQENLPKAEEEYQAALQSDPNLIEVLNLMGEIKRHQFKFEEAISYYSRAAKLNPRDYESAYGLGASQLYLQQPALAVDHFQRALSVNPDAAPARLALGDAFLRLGKPDLAVKELERATQLEPKMRQAYTLLGRSYRQLGQTEKAQEAFRKSQALVQEELQQKRHTLKQGQETMIPPLSPQKDSQGP